MANKERKALGTGLSALFGSETLEDETVTTLPLSKIEPRTQQPREVFEEDALQTLAESIARYGVIQPITVRPLSSGFYQIIAGERRWRASRLAGLMEVPVRILQVDDRTTAEALIGNGFYINREVLPALEDEDEFYEADLIGLEVRQDNQVIRTVAGLYNFGAGEIIEIKHHSRSLIVGTFQRGKNFGFVIPDDKLESASSACEQMKRKRMKFSRSIKMTASESSITIERLM